MRVQSINQTSSISMGRKLPCINGSFGSGDADDCGTSVNLAFFMFCEISIASHTFVLDYTHFHFHIHIHFHFRIHFYIHIHIILHISLNILFVVVVVVVARFFFLFHVFVFFFFFFFPERSQCTASASSGVSYSRRASRCQSPSSTCYSSAGW